MNSPDEGVDLSGLDVVQLLDSVLDLTLVVPDVNNEDKSVVLLDLLHRGFRVQWPISQYVEYSPHRFKGGERTKQSS